MDLCTTRDLELHKFVAFAACFFFWKVGIVALLSRFVNAAAYFLYQENSWEFGEFDTLSSWQRQRRSCHLLLNEVSFEAEGEDDNMTSTRTSSLVGTSLRAFGQCFLQRT